MPIDPRFIEWDSEPVGFGTDSISPGQDGFYDEHVRQEAERQGVDPDFAVQIHRLEHSPKKAVSSKGAIGPMQLMPATAKELGVDPWDTGQNIKGGVSYIKQMLDQFGGDRRLAAAAYNAGPGAVKRYGGVPPFSETQKYVSKLDLQESQSIQIPSESDIEWDAAPDIQSILWDNEPAALKEVERQTAPSARYAEISATDMVPKTKSFMATDTLPEAQWMNQEFGPAVIEVKKREQIAVPAVEPVIQPQQEVDLPEAQWMNQPLGLGLPEAPKTKQPPAASFTDIQDPVSASIVLGEESTLPAFETAFEAADIAMGGPIFREIMSGRPAEEMVTAETFPGAVPVSGPSTTVGETAKELAYVLERHGVPAGMEMATAESFPEQIPVSMTPEDVGQIAAVATDLAAYPAFARAVGALGVGAGKEVVKNLAPLWYRATGQDRKMMADYLTQMLNSMRERGYSDKEIFDEMGRLFTGKAPTWETAPGAAESAIPAIEGTVESAVVAQTLKRGGSVDLLTGAPVENVGLGLQVAPELPATPEAGAAVTPEVPALPPVQESPVPPSTVGRAGPFPQIQPTTLVPQAGGGEVRPEPQALQGRIPGRPWHPERRALQAPGVIEVGPEVEPELSTSEQIDQAAKEAATSPENNLPEPTEAQKEAGNYKKGHVSLHGLEISIENPKGSIRRGVSPEGKPWETKLRHHYGYIKGTTGKDKDHIDVFIGNNPESQRVYVVDQVDPKTGKFDEHKALMGFDSEAEARAAYLSNYEEGWQGLGSITEADVDGFKAWLKDGNTKQPADENFTERTVPDVQKETPEEAVQTGGRGQIEEGEGQGQKEVGTHAVQLTVADLRAKTTTIKGDLDKAGIVPIDKPADARRLLDAVGPRKSNESTPDYLERIRLAQQDLTGPTQLKDIEELRPLAELLWRYKKEIDANPELQRYGSQVGIENAYNFFGITHGSGRSSAPELLRKKLAEYGLTSRAALKELRERFPEYGEFQQPAPGKPTKLYTPSGQEVEAQFTLKEADDLITSHTAAGQTNPDYPAELQPRDRQRAASKLQIRQMAQKLNPALLGESAKASDGAPIIGADNVVESGNARTLAIKEAYQAGGAESYRQFLKDNAEQFGLDPAEIDRMKTPVLVRQRTSEVDRVNFTKDANKADIASMSPVEVAKNDAQMISDDHMSSWNPPDDGNILSSKNRSFVNQFIQLMPQQEAAQYLTKDGRYTKQLTDRIQAAVFAKAYGDDRLISLMAEEADIDIKNIITALNSAAGEFSKVKATAGDMGELDVVPHIVEAVNLIRQAKIKNSSVAQILAQQNMFQRTSPQTAAIAKFLDHNKRSGKRMGDGLRMMAGLIGREIERSQNMELFNRKKPTIGDIISVVDKQIKDLYGKEPQGTQLRFGGETPGVRSGGGQPIRLRGTSARDAGTGNDSLSRPSDEAEESGALYDEAEGTTAAYRKKAEAAGQKTFGAIPKTARKVRPSTEGRILGPVQSGEIKSVKDFKIVLAHHSKENTRTKKPDMWFSLNEPNMLNVVVRNEKGMTPYEYYVDTSILDIVKPWTETAVERGANLKTQGLQEISYGWVDEKGKTHYYDEPRYILKEDIKDVRPTTKPPTRKELIAYATTPPDKITGMGGALERSRGGVRTLGIGIRRDLINKERVDLRGKTINSLEDVALLTQIYRNPQFETFRIIYTKGGKIVAHEAVTSRLPGSTKAFVDYDRPAKARRDMINRMRRLGADSYYLVHNHPSGTPDPSDADKAMTMLMAMDIPGFKGHVVIDSGKYAVIDRAGKSVLKKLPGIPENWKDDLLSPEKYHDLLYAPLEYDDQAAAYGKLLQTEDGYVSIFYRGSDGRIRAIQEVPEGLLLSPKDGSDYIRGRMKEFGATGAVAAVQNPSLELVFTFEGYMEDRTFQEIAYGWNDVYEPQSALRMFGEGHDSLWAGKDVRGSRAIRVEEEEAPWKRRKPIYVSPEGKASESIKDVSTAKPAAEKERVEAEGTIARREMPPTPTIPTERKPISDKARRSRIISDLSSAFDVPIRYGRFRKRALGIYKRKAKVIRLKRPNDVEVAVHEVGHHIQNLLGFKGRMSDEVRNLAYEGADNLNREGFAEFLRIYVTQNDKALELAPNFYREFEERLLTHPDVREVLTQARQAWEEYAAAPSVAKVMSVIRSGSDTKKKRPTFSEVYRKAIDELNPIRIAVQEAEQALGRKLRNSENPFKLAWLNRGSARKSENFLKWGTFQYTDTGIEFTGPSLRSILEPVEKAGKRHLLDAYLIAKRASADDRIIEGFEGTLSLDDFKQTVSELEGEFKEVAEKLYKYSDELLTYLTQAGRISDELAQSIREKNLFYTPFYRLMDESSFVGIGGKKFANLPNPIKRLRGSSRDIISPTESLLYNTQVMINVAERNRVGEALINLAEVEGFGKYIEKLPVRIKPTTISKDDFVALLAKYGETEQVVSVRESERKLSKTLNDIAGADQKPQGKVLNIVKEALGSRGWTPAEAEQIIDRITSADTPEKKQTIIENTIEKTTIMVVKEKLGLSNMPDAVVANFRPNYTPTEEEMIFYRRGEPEVYFIDKEMREAVRGVGASEINGVVKLLSYPSKTLRAGATSLSLGFSARNPARDQLVAFIQSREKYYPIVDLVRGIFHILNKTELYQTYNAIGAAQANIVSADREQVTKSLQELFNNYTLKEKVVGSVKSPLKALQALSEVMEEGTRVGIFAQFVEKYGAELDSLIDAGLGGRDTTTDFARKGASKSLRDWSMMTAFFNARIQGTEKMFRSIAEDARLIKESPGKAAKNPFRLSTFKALLSVTLPSIALYLAQKDDPYFQELPWWRRTFFWNIALKNADGSHKAIIPIPRPFEWGIMFGAIPEMALEWILKKDPKGFEEASKEMAKALFPDALPTFALGPLEWWAGKNYFFDRPIVPRSKEDLDAVLQYGPHTSDTIRLLTEAMDKVPVLREVASPAKIENLIYNYTAEAGRMSLDTVDTLLRFFRVVDYPARPSMVWSDVPGAGAFVQRFPTANTKSIEELYEKYTKANKEWESSKARMGIRGLSSISPKAKMPAGAKPAELQQFESATKMLSAMRKMADLIFENKELSREEKRKRLDSVYMSMINTARLALGKPAIEFELGQAAR